MKTRESLLFSKVAASVILQTLPHLIQKVEEFENCVLVVARGMRATFVSKKKFYEEFVESRKQRAIDLECEKFSDREYIIINPVNGNRYLIEFNDRGVECGCEDYLNQMQVLGRACCKHCYRGLFEKGCVSLRDYQAQRVEVA